MHSSSEYKASKAETVRLNHFLAQRGNWSRRESDKIIQRGQVTLNGLVEVNPATMVKPDKDRIEVDGEPLTVKRKHLYIAFNKPVGFLSSFKKGREPGKLLGELLKFDRRLIPAGRLDLKSWGLLLLTTDGDWANRVMHPRYEKLKEYLVQVRRVPPKVAVKRLREASFEEDGKIFRAKSVQQHGEMVLISLAEGRYRQIRRLANTVDLEIKSLVRVRIGDVHLGNLKAGGWRNLTRDEIQSFL